MLERISHKVTLAMLAVMLLSCTQMRDMRAEIRDLPANVRDPVFRVPFPKTPYYRTLIEMAVAADVAELSTDLKEAAECVSRTLESISGVQDVTWDALRDSRRIFAAIHYRFLDEVGARRKVEFGLLRSERDAITYYFWQAPFPENGPTPFDISSIWEMRCNVVYGIIVN